MSSAGTIVVQASACTYDLTSMPKKRRHSRSSWWKRTFKEREDAFTELFGVSQPPGAPGDHVISVNPGVVLPGACVQVFPPDPEPSDPRRIPRSDWLYLTHGLSQPLEPGRRWEGVGKAREVDHGLSAYGAEFGILVSQPEAWIAEFLGELMAYVVTEAPVRGGHRVPFGFYRTRSGQRSWFMGTAQDLGCEELDATRAMLFWPLLHETHCITTSTGECELLIGTTITGDEWDLAKATTSGHLLLLLRRAGVGQRTIFGRPSVLDEPRWANEWKRIAPRSYDDVAAELHGALPR